MRRNRRESGEGQFGCLVGIILMLAAGLVAYKMIPIKVKAAELRDTVIDEAKSGGQHTDNKITDEIMRSAERLELPVKEEDIIIERRAGQIRVEVSYTVPVEFPGYTYNWSFRHRQENPVF
jgi:hypothetical protein